MSKEEVKNEEVKQEESKEVTKEEQVDANKQTVEELEAKLEEWEKNKANEASEQAVKYKELEDKYLSLLKKVTNQLYPGTFTDNVDDKKIEADFNPVQKQPEFIKHAVPEIKPEDLVTPAPKGE